MVVAFLWIFCHCCFVIVVIVLIAVLFVVVVVVVFVSNLILGLGQKIITEAYI